MPQVMSTLSWNAPPGKTRPPKKSVAITLGAMHVRYRLRCTALCHWTRATYDPPAMPILPLLHCCSPIHSCVSNPSGPSLTKG